MAAVYRAQRAGTAAIFGAMSGGGVADLTAAVAATGSIIHIGTAAVVASIVDAPPSGGALSAAVAATGSIIHIGTAAVVASIVDAPPSGGALSDGEMRQMFVWVSELARIHGLVAGSPLVVTPTSRQAGTISQSISESGSTVTVSRA